MATLDVVKQSFKELGGENVDPTLDDLPAPSEPGEPDEQISVSDQAPVTGGEIQAPEPLSAPDTWSADAKERFKKVPREAQKLLLEREKSITGDYTRKTQELAEQRKRYQAIDEAWKPYADKFSSRGATPDGLLREYAQLIEALESNPQGTIQFLAQRFGSNQQAQRTQLPADPALRQLHQQVNDLASWQKQQSELEERRRLESYDMDVRDFLDEKDASGEFKRPYFKEVETAVAALLPEIHKANPESDHFTLLDLAYQEAMKPFELAQKAEKDRQIKRAKDARTASVSIAGNRNGAVQSPTRPKDTEGYVRQAYNQLTNN